MAEVRYRWRMGHEPPKTPLVTVDVIIETTGGIVLVRRRHPPAGWALPRRRRGWTSS
jgi:ADP-ribose pyrophosphatase YjhB (NUDIX family)